MVDVKLLRKFSFFKELNEEQLRRFAACIQERQYSKKGVVCSKGDRGDELFFVKEGLASVGLPMYRYDSQYKNVSEIGEGDLFGELSFFDGGERSAYIEAQGKLELLVLSRSDFDKVIKDDLKEGWRIQSKIIAGLTGIIRNINETYSSAYFML